MKSTRKLFFVISLLLSFTGVASELNFVSYPGGSLMGLFQAGIGKQLETDLAKPLWEIFDGGVGTSAGAINLAAAFAADIPEQSRPGAAEIFDRFENNAREIFSWQTLTNGLHHYCPQFDGIKKTFATCSAVASIHCFESSNLLGGCLYAAATLANIIPSPDFAKSRAVLHEKLKMNMGNSWLSETKKPIWIDTYNRQTQIRVFYGTDEAKSDASYNAPLYQLAAASSALDPLFGTSEVTFQNNLKIDKFLDPGLVGYTDPTPSFIRILIGKYPVVDKDNPAYRKINIYVFGTGFEKKQEGYGGLPENISVHVLSPDFSDRNNSFFVKFLQSAKRALSSYNPDLGKWNEENIDLNWISGVPLHYGSWIAYIKDRLAITLTSEAYKNMVRKLSKQNEPS